MILKFTLPLI